MPKKNSFLCVVMITYVLTMAYGRALHLCSCGPHWGDYSGCACDQHYHQDNLVFPPASACSTSSPQYMATDFAPRLCLECTVMVAQRVFLFLPLEEPFLSFDCPHTARLLHILPLSLAENPIPTNYHLPTAPGLKICVLLI